MSNASAAEELPTEEIDLALANEVIDKYLTLPGNLMPVLQGIQDGYGFVPKPTIDLVAERLNVYPSQIYGVLTFYAQFHLKPRGKYIIRVCVGTACHVQGAERITETFFDRLHIGHAETSADLRYTFEKVACLGACGMAPLAMVNDDTYGKMTVQKVDEIIETYNQRPMK
ncbi:NADH-quinone oxidoreductase subunit NuoE family protein [Geomesophilobacter sediminis]|uniref:NAD(P)H-dependent oxidoreductase subunit E n=1 Tax=Geomesophilobacter sediminis TaxID=2798584 RepID=A0A8J7JMN7_9BACT|nr:NAD(P)H-dependent oxidoreductase subunit E [Geomesophilobacter sediminis]MBJ6726020.1 NAD(P)H-dependent oxidoreductase subunit E [Geomesophilobacter sediminis]